jgi:hypothetical protein
MKFHHLEEFFLVNSTISSCIKNNTKSLQKSYYIVVICEKEFYLQ